MNRSLAIAVFLLVAVVACRGWVFKSPRRPPPNIDGGWSAWGNWSQCYLNDNTTAAFYNPLEDFLLSYRNRSCSAPVPVRDGKPCRGVGRRFKQCGCDNPLGMANGRIQAGQLSSTPFIDGHSPEKGRLTGNSAWCSSDAINFMSNIYYEIDLKDVTELSGIAIAGSSLGRVREFKVRYSVSGKVWRLYRDEQRKNGALEGNTLSTGVKNNKFQNNIVARFIRVFPTRSYGKVCMSLELFGCSFTCGDLLGGPRGEIKASSVQEHDQRCMWKIEVPEITSMRLDFPVVDLPCNEAFVELRDGTQPFMTAPVLDRICGEDAKGRTVNSNSVWMKFESNSSSAEVGFTLRYQTECKQTINLLEGETTTVQTPNFPKDYYHNTECTWTVSANPGSALEINFDFLDIEGSLTETGDKSCTSDYVGVNALSPDGTTSPRGRYCNSNRAMTRVVVGSNLCRLVFKSDSAIAGQGFKASITAVPADATSPTTTTTGETAAATPGQPEAATQPSPVSIGIKKTTPVSSNTVDAIQPSSTDAAFDGNKSENVRVTKRRSGRDDQWTTILIGTFSGVVLVMVASVLGINLKKVMGGRQTRTVVVTAPTYPAFKKPETQKAAGPLLDKPAHSTVVVKATTAEEAPESEALLSGASAETNKDTECVEMTSVPAETSSVLTAAGVARDPEHISKE